MAVGVVGRMAELQENMVVADRFRLVKMIGRGGMGSVWQAMHLGLDTPCAVKFIEGELANVAEAHQRFEREAKAAAQLRSPNVVQIFDHGVWEGRPYIAMELLEGQDLGKKLAQHGGILSPSEVNFVIQQVCRALTRAHQAGVVHRDLKPDNIFIVKDDDRDIVKILDFGVAKSAASALDGSNTKTGAMLGTPYYMSPEQAQGIKTVDARSDLWSLAVIVFQCLTGRLPFESEALGDLLVKIIVNKVPVPSEAARIKTNIPVGFDAWWVRAAERNVDARFPTAKAFAESLSIALGQSSNTEMERGRLNRGSERPGGATAMMVNAPGTEVYAHVPNTPQPGVHTAAMQTPNPMHTPPNMHSSQPGVGGMQQGGPPPGTGPMGSGAGPHGNPHQSYPGYGPQGTTGNPVAATFSGIDPNGVPKKSSVGIVIGIGAVIALVGIGLGGVAIVRGRNASGPIVDPATLSNASGTPVASASVTATASVTAAGEPSSAPVAKAAETAATAAAADAGADPATATPAVAAAAANGGVHRPAGNGGGHAPTGGGAKPPPATPATPPAAPVAAPAKPAGTQKPINLGF
ncbi:MAG: eukaryotic-like serine/threonine-protein kinase [Myxococcales bacterium]|nr:eukaryotic-like serine/threonine-protein kinase [Myxococcales bacterium]